MAGCVLIAAVIASSVYKSRLHRRWDAEIARLRSDGVPVTVAELNALYPAIADEENGAVAVLQAMAGLRQPNIDVGLSPDYLSWSWIERLSRMELVLSPDELQNLGAFLSSNAEVIEQLHALSRFTRFRYPIDPGESRFFSTAHLESVHYAAALCTVDAIYAAEQSDAERITEDFLCALRLSTSLSKEPLVLSQVTRTTLLQSTVRALELCLRGTTFTDEQLGKLEAAFSDSEVEGAFVLALAGELCAMLNFWQDQNLHEISGGQSGVFSTFLFDELPWVGGPILRFLSVAGINFHQKLFYLEVVGKSIDIARQPFAKAVISSRRLEAELRGAPSLIVGEMAYAVSYSLNMSGRQQESYAFARLARTAIAIKRYSLEHDDTLYELDALVPEYLDAVPLDPFDEKPLRMRGFPGGVVVYSIGENATDDGGVEGGSREDLTIAVWE